MLEFRNLLVCSYRAMDSHFDMTTLSNLDTRISTAFEFLPFANLNMSGLNALMEKSQESKDLM